MPIYEYECNACGARHEFIQKFSDGPKRKCPDCGKNRLRKLVSAAAFHLKGEGWYVTDFRDKDKKKKDEQPSTSSSASDEKSATKSESKSETKAETKSSSKTESKSSGDTKAASK